MLLAFLVWSISLTQDGEGPSFSCAHVTSKVNGLICASPGLSALDRDLATVFGNMRGQGAINQKKLRSDEDAWLAGMRRDCIDEGCIRKRYEERIGQLKDESLRAASPAAYEETRPFPVAQTLWEEARGLVGKECGDGGKLGPTIPGFAVAPRFLPVFLKGSVTSVREKSGARFAFLTDVSPAGGCEIRDVVALPATAAGDRFLQCSVDDPVLAGIGVRNLTTHLTKDGLDGFWSVNTEEHKLERVAMGVLGIDKSVRCRQPEEPE